MRSDPTQFALTAPANLTEALALLSEGVHTPIAGGTEIMVALNTGRLTQKSLLSIQHLAELRFIRVEPDAIHIGAGTTFTDIRNHPTIAAEFPILIDSASWTGTIANQNRATLGGNICNASPAADTPPALLCYDATVTLVSSSAAAGEIATRTIPYADFHLSYKKTALQPNELLHTVTIPRAFAGYRQYLRKVGTRNALAISKIALAGVVRLEASQPEDHIITDIRLGAASLADRPIRCHAAEAALLNQPITATSIAAARAALLSEACPIDDIRSTAAYRAAVAANLLEDFLRSLII